MSGDLTGLCLYIRVFPWCNGPHDEKIMKNDDDYDKKSLVVVK